MTDRMRTLWGGLLAWLAAALLDATIVAVQQGVPFVYSLPGSATQYGILALLGILVWISCRWSHSRPRSLLAVVAMHAVMAVAVVAAWQSAYLGLFYWV